MSFSSTVLMIFLPSSRLSTFLVAISHATIDGGNCVCGAPHNCATRDFKLESALLVRVDVAPAKINHATDTQQNMKPMANNLLIMGYSLSEFHVARGAPGQ